MKLGILALQGAFAAHQRMVEQLGCTSCQVREPDDLETLDALLLPGGESTTMSKLLVTSGLGEAIGAGMADGLAVFGTCAGMILLAREIEDARDDQTSFAALDITVRRNAYGRQVDSFESGIVVEGLEEVFPAVFIRAPRITRTGEVEVLARHGDEPVLVRGGRVWAASFHPELAGDDRIHRMFVEWLRRN
jgi:5'-phosphate synthase pdxT subunit